MSRPPFGGQANPKHNMGLGTKIGRSRRRTFANSTSGKNIETSWGWWKEFIVSVSSMRREPSIYGLHWCEIPAHEEIYGVFDQNPCRYPP